MVLEISESDVKQVLSKVQIASVEADGDLKHLNISDALDMSRIIPRAIIKKAFSLAPQGYEVMSTELIIELAGKPFGVGITGKLQVLVEKAAIPTDQT